MPKSNLYFIGLCSFFFVSGVLAKLDDTGNRHEQSVRITEPEQTRKETISKLSRIANDEYGLSVNESLIPSVRQGEQMLKEMCERNNASSDENDPYTSAHMAVKNVEQCFDGIITFTELPAKIEAARPHGNLDQVFHGYCRRSDELKGCIQKFLVDIDPCLAADQKNSKYTIQNITEAILNFACENEGDYIALFISEKGPQCISNQQPGIEQCIKKGLNDTKSFESYVEAMNSTNTELTKEDEKSINLNFELQHCRNAYAVRNCIIEELKKCSGSTPANVVESIFNLIQRSTTCSKYTRTDMDPSYNNSMLLKSTLSLLIPVITILLCKTIWY